MKTQRVGPMSNMCTVMNAAGCQKTTSKLWPTENAKMWGGILANPPVKLLIRPATKKHGDERWSPLLAIFMNQLRNIHVDKEFRCEPCGKTIKVPTREQYAQCSEVDAMELFVDHVLGDIHCKAVNNTGYLLMDLLWQEFAVTDGMKCTYWLNHRDGEQTWQRRQHHFDWSRCHTVM